MIKAKNQKILMTIEEKNLIMKSSICDKDKTFKNVLQQFSKSISKKDSEKIKNIHSRVYQIIKTRDAIEKMRDDASKEWVQKQYHGNIQIPCQLCKSKLSKDKFEIINVINGNKLLVGSSCIDKFPKMDNKLNGLLLSQIKRLAKNNPKKYQRIVEFNKKYDGGKIIFEDWRNKYSSYDIIFPQDYDDKFYENLSRGRKFYNNYINGSLNKDDLKKFQYYIDEFNYLYNKCKEFYENNKEDRYICTKNTSQLLIDDGLSKTLSYIKNNNSKIKSDIARYVYHIDFVKRFENDIDNTFNKYSIKYKSLNQQYINFTFQYKNFNKIKLQSSLKNFVFKFSNVFYDKAAKFDKKYMFDGLNILNEYKNVDEFVQILNYILRKTKYYLNIDYELYNHGKIELYKNITKQFCEIKVAELIKFKDIFYLKMEDAISIMINKFDEINRWSDISDKDKFDIGDISHEWSMDKIK